MEHLGHVRADPAVDTFGLVTSPAEIAQTVERDWLHLDPFGDGKIHYGAAAFGTRIVIDLVDVAILGLQVEEKSFIK